MNFTTEQSRRNLQIGYLDTLRVLDKMEGRHYYIYDAPTDQAVLEAMMAWPADLQKKIYTALDLSQSKTLNRLFLEEALPHMIDIF